MSVEICTVGGFSEVGKNMTAIKVDDEVVLLDMGLNLEPYIKYTEEEEEDVHDMSAFALTRIGAIPDIKPIMKWKDKVRAIIPTHAHLDHVGAIPYLSNKFKAEILATAFTAEIIKTICKDEKISLKNQIKVLNPNSKYMISKNITVEFVHMTHSTPQTVMAAIHTKYGTIVYCNDFKFDAHPVLGKKANIERLKEIGKKNKVICLIADAIYSGLAQKTPSEQVARDMLKDVMLGTESQGKAIIVTTFSSHLARLKSIIEFGLQLHRKVVLLGRSLHKYVTAGEAVGIISFRKDAEIIKYRKQIARKLKQIEKNPSKYLIVCTGHQGEPKAVLARIANKEFDFKLRKEDHIIFSCTTIPVPLNVLNRADLEKSLKQKGVRLFTEIHVSGHAAREDLRDLIHMLRPKHIIPAHADWDLAGSLADLAKELGYKLGENVHLMKDGEFLVIK